MNRKLLYIGMKYDYGNKARGLSFEHRNFYHSLKSYCGKQDWDFIHYDFMERGMILGLDLMTQELYELAKKEKPTYLFAVLFDFHRDPGHEVFKHISSLGTTTIHWFCDDHWRFEKYSSVVAPHFDFVCTTAKSALPKYEELGISHKVIKSQWACNYELYVPYDIEKDLDISFVGQPHGNRVEVLSKLIESGLKLEVFGFGWENRPRIPFHQMVRLFSRSKINLNLSNSSTLIGQQIKGRNFEIPGTRSFLLTSNAENLSEYYEDGKEIVIFDTAEELVDKATYYLKNENERNKIAENGYKRTLAEHTWHHRLDEIFGYINTKQHHLLTPGETLVSVIIPCYNQAHFLPEAVESVANQTFTDWECIIVNDSSPDNTSETARQLIANYSDKQIRLIEKRNGGLSDARNVGIKNSKGKFILPLDADDLIHPEMLQKTVSLLKTHSEIAIAYTDVRHFGSANRIVCAGEYDFKRLCLQNHLNYCSLYRREAWESAGGYNPNMVWGYEDWDFWISCGEKGYYGKRISEPLFMYRVKETSMYTKALEHHGELMARIILNHPSLYDQKYALEAKKMLDQCSTGKLVTIHPHLNLPHQGGGIQGNNEYSPPLVGGVRGGGELLQKLKTNPMVSVIVPTYNRPDTLKRTLESIAAQTYKRIEAIVVNDAGEDVSGVIDTFQDRLSIKYLVHDKNKSLAAVRNTAIKHASGRYIAYLDDDDIFYPDHIETALMVLTNINYKVVYTDAYRAYQAKEGDAYQVIKKDIPYSIDYVKDIFYKTNITPVLCVVHDRACFDRVGIFDESLPVLEDWDLWIRMAEKYDFYHIKKVTCEFSWRADGTSTTSSKQDEFARVRELIYKKYYQKFQDALAQTSAVARKPVSIIILTWNALEYTQKCVNSIRNHTSYPHEIVFVDNASTDGTVEYLRNLVKAHPNYVTVQPLPLNSVKEPTPSPSQEGNKKSPLLGGDLGVGELLPNYKLIENRENKGFAAGNNQGVSAASGEYVMLLNNDVLVSDGWLESLVESLERDEHIGMVGPITNSISGRQQVNKIPYTDEQGFYKFAQEIRRTYKGRLTPRYRVAGFAVLMKKALYEEAGGLDESFGTGNYEDDDLCLKVSGKGYAIMADEGVFIHHYRSQTFVENKINYRNSLSVNGTKFKEKWPNVDYEQLLELHGSLVDTNAALCAKGKQAQETGNINKAIEIYSRVLKTNPIDEAALCGLAIVYQTDGKMDKTIDAYKKALQVNPSFFDAHYNLAIVYSSINQIDDAIAHLNKAINLNSSDASVHNNLGVLYFKKYMYNDAKNCFERALRIDVHYKEAQQNLEKIRKIQGNSSPEEKNLTR